MSERNPYDANLYPLLPLANGKDTFSPFSTSLGALPVAFRGIRSYPGIPHALRPSSQRQLGDYVHPSAWNGYKSLAPTISLHLSARVAVIKRAAFAWAPTKAYPVPVVRLTVRIDDQHMAVPAPEGLPLPVGTSRGNAWSVQMGRFGFAFEIQKPYATFSPDAATEIAAGLGQIEEAFTNRGEALIYESLHGVQEMMVTRLLDLKARSIDSPSYITQLLKERAAMHNVVVRNPRAVLTLYREADTIKDTLMGTESSLMMLPHGCLDSLRSVLDTASVQEVGEQAFRDTFGVTGVSNLTVGPNRPIVESRPLEFLREFHSSREPLSEPFEFACHYSFTTGAGSDVTRVWIRDMIEDGRKCFSVGELEEAAYDATKAYNQEHPNSKIERKDGATTFLILRLRVLRQVASAIVGKGGGAWAHLGHCFPLADVADTGEEERTKISQRGHMGVIVTNQMAVRRFAGAAYVRDGLVSGGGTSLHKLKGTVAKGALSAGAFRRGRDLAVIKLDGNVDIPGWLYQGKNWGSGALPQRIPPDLAEALEHLFSGSGVLSEQEIVCPSIYDNRAGGKRLPSGRGPMVIEYTGGRRVHVFGEGYECPVLYPNTNAAEERRPGANAGMFLPTFPSDRLTNFE